MYEAFDAFLAVDTWHTGHPSDGERFYKVLHEVVQKPGFNPDQMGQHMREKLGVPIDDEDHPFNSAIDRYVAAAWAVKEYLQANSL